CKGCKGDCPVNVDVATYKAEFLAHYWYGRVRPLHSYFFGWVDKWASLASVSPSLANAMLRIPFVERAAKRLLGIARERRIPRFSTTNFRKWFSNRGKSATGNRSVLLWVDTFNNHFRPETLIAALEVLESAGYSVQLPSSGLCCGRPLYD